MKSAFVFFVMVAVILLVAINSVKNPVDPTVTRVQTYVVVVKMQTSDNLYLIDGMTKWVDTRGVIHTAYYACTITDSEATRNVKIWSDMRKAWVGVKDLRPGDKVAAMCLLKAPPKNQHG